MTAYTGASTKAFFYVLRYAKTPVYSRNYVTFTTSMTQRYSPLSQKVLVFPNVPTIVVFPKTP